MKKHINYIIGISAIMVSCTDNAVEPLPFLNGVEKTPIAVRLGVGETTGLTRAVDAKFETDDLLLAYFRHVVPDSNTPATYKDVYDAENNDVAGIKPRLVGFMVTPKTGNESKADNYTNHSASSTLVTTDASGVAKGLYWDDFSVGAKGDATDIRTDAHALQSYYGYCYNGGTPSTALNEATGVLGWTVAYDQTSATAVKNADLLWSQTQSPVSYSHGDSQTSDHGVISIPYTHAMTEFTVVVQACDGFVEGALLNTQVILSGVNRQCTTTAPEGTYSDYSEGPEEDEPGKISLYGDTETPAKTSGGEDCRQRTFIGITVPESQITIGAELVSIIDADGNNYVVKVTQQMIDSWKGNDADNYGLSGSDNNLTRPGYNYKLTVVINKQTVSVETSLANWKTVTAEGEGEIQFPNNVDQNGDLSINITGDDGHAGTVTFNAADIKKFSDGSNFDLYDLKWESATQETGNEQFGDRQTISTYNSTIYKWDNDPEIYWPNATDQYYFRALAIFDGESDNKYNILTTGKDNPSLEANQGIDLVWGTTAKHNGYNGTTLVHEYEEGQAINPRTGDVPIAFRHIMSKITVKLATATGDPTPDNAVVLEGALISITKLANTGTVQLYSGIISNGSLVDNPITGFCAQNYPVTDKPALDNYLVIPQALTDDCKITITLANNQGTYSLRMNQCKTGTAPDQTLISTWAPGRHYEYTITLTKEEIHFQAMVKDWIEVYGHGDANMEWE